MNKVHTIAVIGLGLIGGSILKSLQNKGFYLIGISRSDETVKKTLELNLADKCSKNIEDIKEADIIFICTPISKVIDIIDKVKEITKPDCIISDVASLKSFIIEHINNNDKPINFIGGHPMAGTENKGIDYAIDDLFVEAKWVLTPSKWSNSQQINKLKKIIESLGAKVLITDPKEHDKAVALISHMPLLLSQALFGFVNNYPDDNIKKLALSLASSGFRDMTRLVMTNTELVKDMILGNKINIEESLNGLKDYVNYLTNYINQDQEKFLELSEELCLERKNLYSPEGKNIFT